MQHLLNQLIDKYNFFQIIKMSKNVLCQPSTKTRKRPTKVNLALK